MDVNTLLIRLPTFYIGINGTKFPRDEPLGNFTSYRKITMLSIIAIFTIIEIKIQIHLSNLQVSSTLLQPIVISHNGNLTNYFLTMVPDSGNKTNKSNQTGD